MHKIGAKFLDIAHFVVYKARHYNM